MKQRLRCYAAVGWGLIIAFALVGALLGKEAAVMIAFISGMMWVLNRIVVEAFDAAVVIMAPKTKPSASADPPDDDRLAGA